MEQLEIDYYGVTFTVWGYYTKYLRPIDIDQVIQDADFEIIEVYNGNDNIIQLLKENMVTELEEKALEILND